MNGRKQEFLSRWMIVNICVITKTRQQSNVDSGEVANVLDIVEIVGGDDILGILRHSLQVLVQLHPLRWIEPSKLIPSRCDDDDGAVERHVELAHGCWMEADESVDEVHFGLIFVELVDLANSCVGWSHGILFC